MTTSREPATRRRGLQTRMLHVFLISLCISGYWFAALLDGAVLSAVQGQTRAAKCVSCPAPPLPAYAAEASKDARIVLRVTIERNGQVTPHYAISGHPLLYAAAIEAVRGWRYQPALLNGERVPLRTAVTVRFRQALGP